MVVALGLSLPSGVAVAGDCTLAPLDHMILRVGETDNQSGWIATGTLGVNLHVVNDTPSSSTAGPISGTVTPDYVGFGSTASLDVESTVPSTVSQRGVPFQILRPEVQGYYEVPSSVECRRNFQVCVKPTTGQSNVLDGWTGTVARWQMEILPATADFDGRLVEERTTASVAVDTCHAAMVANGGTPSCVTYA
jgi:hypothetical protein